MTDKPLVLADGREGVRRYRTDYFGRLNASKPSMHNHPGFPKGEDGSIDGVMKAVAKGYIAKGACYDRVEGKYLWTVRRGPKVPGTRLYTPLIEKGGV